MKKFLVILTAFLAVFALLGCDGRGGGSSTPTGGSKTEKNWTIATFSGLTINETPGEYVGNTGLQAGDKDNTTLAIDGSTLKITASGSAYKPINVQVGTATGGTAYYHSEGFTAASGVEYTITFKASVASGSGQVRFAANGGTMEGTVTLDTAPKDVSYTWTQAATGGNFKFDTGNTAVGTALIITPPLKITWME